MLEGLNVVFYVGWEILSVLLSKAKVDKRKAALFLMLLLWLLMALRSISLGINDTSGIYYYAFKRVKILSLKGALNENIFINEPLMTFFTWMCSKIMNFRFYIALCSLIPILSFYKFICNNAVKPIYGVIIFWALFFFYESFLIKQMLAISLVLFAYEYLKKDQFMKYLLLILMAGLIHKSAFILIIAYFCCKYVRFDKLFFLLTIGAMLFGLFFGQTILNFLYKFPLYNFEAYIREGIYGTNGSINFSMFIYPLLTFLCYFFLRNEKNTIYKKYLCLMFIGCVLNTWSIVVVEFYRLALYFMTPVCIMIPEAIQNVPVKYRKIINFIILAFFLLYAYKIAFNCNCISYRSFLYDE